MPLRQWIPYRGDGLPKNTKPRKRFMNLNKEIQKETDSILNILMLFGGVVLLVLIFGDGLPYSGIQTAIIIIGAIITLTIIASVLDFSRFRKGYDVDTSSEDDEDFESE